MQLQQSYDRIRKLGAEVISVHREDKLLNKGLQRTMKSTAGEFLFLSDYKNVATKSYSQGAFFTYVIDKSGVIRKILPGAKRTRAGVKSIIGVLETLGKP